MTTYRAYGILGSMRPERHRGISTVFLFFAIIGLAGCGDLSVDGASDGSGFLLASSIDAGDNHACAVSSGKVKCWGLNSSGQLGDNTAASPLAPVTVSGITGAVQVSAGSRHSCALLSNGTVWCWGDNVNGQLGNSSNTNSRVPVQVSGLAGATGISAGGSHTCAVLADGTAWCWGRNTEGQLGNSSNAASNIPVPVSGMTTAASIAAGGLHTCARLQGSTVQCWGSNLLNQIGNSGITAVSRNIPVPVIGLTSAASISAGTAHTCAEVTSPPGVRCWGSNTSGQLARLWTPAIFPLPPGTSSPEALPVPGLSAPAGVAAGASHSCALLTDNSVLCWGENADGQLGNGNFFGFIPPDGVFPATSTISPVFVSGISSASQVSAGQFHSCALLFTGQVMCWGRNTEGQLGDGTGVFSATPVQVLETTTP